MSSILALTRYSRQAGSSRTRHFDHIAHIEADGHEVTASAFFADSHISRIYHGHHASKLDYVNAYANRAWNVATKPDVLWIEKEVFPFLPAPLDRTAMRRARKTIVDLDDAWFLRYENGHQFLKSKMHGVFDQADIVTVANEFLAEAVSERGGRDIRIIPQGIDLERYVVTPRRPGPVRIGWIGTPLNAKEYLAPLTETLNKITSEMDAEVFLVGAGTAVPELKAERRDWSEATEINDLQDFDIGIMPLGDSLWNRCKSGYKLLQTMACGRMPVGARVGYNSVLVSHGENGLLVEPNNLQNWSDTLRAAVADDALREKLGAAARQRIVTSFDVANTRKPLLQVFE